MKARVPALLFFMLMFGVFVITQSVDGKWTGTLKGDEIAMKRMAAGREGQPQEFVLKREK